MRGAHLMHWFWRATIGAGVGSATLGVLIIPFLDPLVAPQFGTVASFIYFGIVPQMTGIGTYGLLTRAYGPKTVDNETRCRKCHYILRGITKPRCPECGEKI
jgi:hypothetical protein